MNLIQGFVIYKVTYRDWKTGKKVEGSTLAMRTGDGGGHQGYITAGLCRSSPTKQLFSKFENCYVIFCRTKFCLRT